MGQRLGQHFLRNPHYARELVRAVHITAEDTVLEIGPGTGALTAEILKAGKRVIAVEKDPELVAILQETFPAEIARGRLRIVESDIRDFEPTSHKLQAGAYVLAANIPYYITGELLRKFLESPAPPRTIGFLMQKEVADRILSKKESILSISVKAYGIPKIAARVSRGNFSPPPSVDSAILVVSEISKHRFKEISESAFFETVRAGFASKRKLLANNLRAKFLQEKVVRAMRSAKISPSARAEDVHLDSWFPLAAALH